jgi:hypothetical protein
MSLWRNASAATTAFFLDRLVTFFALAVAGNEQAGRGSCITATIALVKPAA